MKTALVSLNSFYRCGESTGMCHLLHRAPDWVDGFAVNPGGKPLSTDLPTPSKLRYIKDRDISQLSSYDIIIIYSTRWEGKYRFLSDLSAKRVGILVHETDSFLTSNISNLLENFGRRFTPLCLDKTVEQDWWRLFGLKAVRIMDAPFDLEFLPKPSPLKKRGELIVTTRFSSSKRPEYVAEIVRKARGLWTLTFYGVGTETVVTPIFNHPRIFLKTGVYGWDEIAKVYSYAMAMLDGSRWEKPHVRMQYSFMEAIYHSCAILCDKDWFGGELVNGETALELSTENVERILEDRFLWSKLVQNSWEIPPRHDAQKALRKMIEVLG